MRRCECAQLDLFAAHLTWCIDRRQALYPDRQLEDARRNFPGRDRDFSFNGHAGADQHAGYTAVRRAQGLQLTCARELKWDLRGACKQLLNRKGRRHDLSLYGFLPGMKTPFADVERWN